MRGIFLFPLCEGDFFLFPLCEGVRGRFYFSVLTPQPPLQIGEGV
jgi:hypothetical protein